MSSVNPLNFPKSSKKKDFNFSVVQSFEFGPFRLDPAKRILEKQGELVPLGSKAYDLLLLLIEESGRTVEKDELMKRLWPDSFVEEGNLSVQVSALRKALGESPSDHQYIVTVPGRGYHFAKPVKAVETVKDFQVFDDSRPAKDKFPLIHRIGVAAILLLALSVGGWFYLGPLRQKSPVPSPRIIPITSFQGYEMYPAFSPDGNQIAYAWDRQKNGNFDIYIQLIGAGAPLQLTRDADPDLCPAWSPDGRYIAFIRQSQAGAGIFLVPALGGHERKLADLAKHKAGPPHLSWSQDGESLVIVDKGSPLEQPSLFRLSIQTGQRKRLTFSTARPFGDSGPAVSPDGKTVAFFRHSDTDAADVYLVPFRGGEPRRLTFFNGQIHGFAWTADGREIIFSSYREGSNGLRLWRVGAFGGKPEELGGLGGNLAFPSVSRLGNRLSYVQGVQDANIWRLDGLSSGHKKAQPVKLIATTRYDFAPRYSPDGQRIAFISDRSGKEEFWICDSEGHSAYPLSSDGRVGAYDWSPDGQHIVFNCITNTSGLYDIYVVSAEGGVIRQLTSEKATSAAPCWSRDGEWIFFGSDRSGDWQVWKIPFAGGQAVQVTRKGGFASRASPDGKFLYYTKSPPSGHAPPIPGLWKLPVEGGEEVPIIETLEVRLWGNWDIVDRGIYFVETVSDNSASSPPAVLKFMSFATGQIKEITPLETPPMYANQGLSASPDGRWVLYQDWEEEGSDIMLVENFH